MKNVKKLLLVRDHLKIILKTIKFNKYKCNLELEINN